MDTEIPKKVKTGSRRHTTPSSLMRSISKRLSAPIRSENKHAHRQNEQAYSGETTSLHERRGIIKRGSILSLMNYSKSSRLSSAASSSLQSRADSGMPTQPGSSAETSILGGHRISGPMASAATASSILQKYSRNQLIDAGKREDRVEAVDDEQAGFFDNGLPPSTKNPTSPSLTAVRREGASGPLEPLLLDSDASDASRSSIEYISLRSQWTMTISDLLTKEAQTSTIARLTNEGLSHEHLALIKELRQHIRDFSDSSSITTYTNVSTPRTDLSEESKSIAEVYEYTGGPIFEEPCCISETASLSDHFAEPKGVSCHLQLSQISTAFSTNDNMTEKRTQKVEDEASKTSQEERKYTAFSLRNPLFRQALQPSPEDEHSDAEDYFSINKRLLRIPPPTQPQMAVVSKTPPVPDPILLTVLARTKDDGPSGEETRQLRHALVMKILGRNVEQWSGGIDDLDLRIEGNRRVRGRRFVTGEGWMD